MTNNRVKNVDGMVGEGVKFERVRRITGYLTGDISRWNAGKVAELTEIDRKTVDKIFAEMKKDGTIVSPVRCKWEPAKK